MVRIHHSATKQQEHMSKLTDTLRAALEKKKGVRPTEPDGSPAVEKKARKTGAASPVKKPPAKSAGRGR